MFQCVNTTEDVEVKQFFVFQMGNSFTVGEFCWFTKSGNYYDFSNTVML